MGSLLGVSRSTARRYLEYLAEKGEASVEFEVSDVGRPVKLYRPGPG
jgi:Response regulator of citrate/malate metabolism